MTAVGLQPLYLRNATLVVDEDDYTAAVTEVTFWPQVQYDWVASWDGPYEPAFISTQWTVTFTYLQDVATPESLTRYLLEQAAAVRTVAFTTSSGGTVITADALILPGPVGGPTGQNLTATVTLPLFDEPAVS